MASATDGEGVSKLYYQFLPDVLILDLRLPKKDGPQVLNELVTCGKSKPQVIIMTTFDCEETIFKTVRAGARGYLVESCRPSRNSGSSALRRERGNLLSFRGWVETS